MIRNTHSRLVGNWWRCYGYVMDVITGQTFAEETDGGVGGFDRMVGQFG
mgnify:CR=1